MPETPKVVIPRIISVDDHVIEPPNVWQDRLPAKYKEIGPRLERRKVKNMKFVGGVFSYDAAADNEDGLWCDWWLIEDLQYPLTRLSAAAGYPRDEITVSPSPWTTCARAAGSRRRASRTWTSTTSTLRSRSRASRVSAARRSPNARTRSSATSASRRTTTGCSTAGARVRADG